MLLGRVEVINVLSICINSFLNREWERMWFFISQGVSPVASFGKSESLFLACSRLAVGCSLNTRPDGHNSGPGYRQLHGFFVVARGGSRKVRRITNGRREA